MYSIKVLSFNPPMNKPTLFPRLTGCLFSYFMSIIIPFSRVYHKLILYTSYLHSCWMRYVPAKLNPFISLKNCPIGHEHIDIIACKSNPANLFGIQSRFNSQPPIEFRTFPRTTRNFGDNCLCITSSLVLAAASPQKLPVLRLVSVVFEN